MAGSRWADVSPSPVLRWCQRLEDRAQAGCDLALTADHEAEAFGQPPDAAARADVEEVQAPFGHLGGPAHGVPIVRVAAVDDHVIAREERKQGIDRFVDGLSGRHHQPDRPRRRELLA